MPRPEFGEHHSRVIAAPPERCWDALLTLRWTHLRVGHLQMRLRGLGLSGRLDQPALDLFDPVSVREDDAPRSIALAMIGKPWSPIPASHKPDSFAEVAEFAEPGWLRYGMDWTLTPLPDGRTLVETRTLCQPTDARARRRFGTYWTGIGPFSRALRVGMLATIDRRACAPDAAAA